MAISRPAQCPECSTVRQTKAQPRTKLKCGKCGTLYAAPPIPQAQNPTPEPTPEPTPQPTPENVDAARPPTPQPTPENLTPQPTPEGGVKVVRAEAVNISPVAPIRPSADPSDPPTPEPTPQNPPAAPSPTPEPTPVGPAAGPLRGRRTARSRIKGWRGPR